MEEEEVADAADDRKDVTDHVDDDKPVYYFEDHLHTLAEADLLQLTAKKILTFETGYDRREAGIEKNDEVGADYVEAVEEVHLWISGDGASVEIEDLDCTLEVLECH